MSNAAKFANYDANNPAIYEGFIKYSLELIKAGKTKISAYLIFERMRWEAAISVNLDGYKLNNNFRPYYARKFMEEFPQYAGYFTLRQVAA